VKFTSFDITGFMAIGEARLDLKDKGLILIQGENRDDESAKSNGAGKSSVVDAISWCLFGLTARGESGDAIINNNHKYAYTKVIIEQEDGQQYSIMRTRKHPKHKNRVKLFRWGWDDEEYTWVDMTAGTDKATQELINKVIGCDHTVFNAAIYQGQEKIPNLPTFTDKQLKELVEETAGINILQDCYTKAREKLRGADTIFKSVDERLGRVEEALDKCKNDLKIVKARNDNWQDEQDARVEMLRLTYEDKKEAWGEAAAKLKSAEEKRPKIEANIKTLKKTLKRKDELAEELEEMRSVLGDLETDVAIALSNRERIESKMKRLQSDLLRANERVGTPCGECGKTIEEDDLSGVITSAKAAIADANADYLTANDLVSAAKEKAAKQEKAVDKFKAAIPDYSEATEKLMKCREVITKIDGMASRVDLLRDAMDEAQSAWEFAEEAENPHEDAINTLVNDLVDYKASHKKHKKEYKDALAQRALYEQAVEVFAPAGVRAHILDHVTPFLNARTGHYLSTLSDGNLSAVWTTLSKTAKGELREKFSIEVSNAKGGKSFGLLSGGEKRKVRLACAMALQDVVSQRATKPIDLFMADEIDDALDEAGLERLMAILDEKARERGTVLVVSHNSLSDWIREVATVTKEGGESTIDGALC